MYHYLNQPIEQISGIGKALAGKLAGRGVSCFGDLLLHLPREYVNDSEITPVAGLREGETLRVEGVVLRKVARGFGRNRQVSMTVADTAGDQITAIFFHSGYMMQDARLAEGQHVTLRGPVKRWQGRWQMQHPEWLPRQQFRPGFHPVYPSLAGLTGKRVGGFIREILTRMPNGAATPVDSLLADYPTLRQALLTVHLFDIEMPPATGRHMERLKLEELLIYFQLIREKRAEAEVTAPAMKGRALAEKLVAALPYPLTDAQRQASDDIAADLASGSRMHRLLQGDVGAGKTWVAALAIAQAVEHGAQAALMAPTEVLAAQHHETLQELLAQIGIEPALLTGSTRAAERKRIHGGLAAGEIRVVVGTHALVSEGVEYRELGLAIVDEQHRFGVRQRWALSEKGSEGNVHLLAMTATPIPRSLALALYGDMDLSVMRGMPPGRKPVETRVLSQKSMSRLAEGMQRILGGDSGDGGGRIYWIVPRIDEEEDGISVTQRVEALAGRFPEERVLGLHGRMKSEEKRRALAAFADGSCRILVSTTVVEVGVNVPEARLIIIEQADRYGLAQLHQLRGRVGRSAEQGYCMLIAGADASAVALERLQLMSRTHDGLELAEADLSMRGAGDAIGVRQSGEAGFRILDMAADGLLIRHWFEKAPSVSADESMVAFWRPQLNEVD